MNESRHIPLKGRLSQLPTAALGIWGSGCTFLQQWAFDISKWNGSQSTVCYIDEKHSSDKPVDKSFAFSFEATENSPLLFSNNSLLSAVVTDYWTNLHELILFNGHHLKGENYWLVWDGKKEFPHGEELINKTVLVCIPTKEWNKVEIIKTKNPKLAHCPILPLEKIPMIIDWLRKWLDSHIPAINGLILAGGKSSRMGSDKATMNFNGAPQVNYLHQLLSNSLSEVFVSSTGERKNEFANMGLNPLADTFTDLGPLGGILSAFRFNPYAAWMVVACDMPAFNVDAIQFLLKHRRTNFMATALKSRYGKFPEPLACIWEPAAYPVLLQKLGQGFSCPVKILSSLPINVVEIPNDEWVANVNAPEDVKKIISKS